jgi:hypothetical protein
MAFTPSVFGRGKEGASGECRGWGVRRRFRDRRGHQGGARACSRRHRRLRRRFLEEEEAGRGPHGSERRGWRWLGRPEAKARWGGRLVAGPGEREAAQGRRRGVGRGRSHGPSEKRKGGRAEAISRVEI